MRLFYLVISAYVVAACTACDSPAETAPAKDIAVTTDTGTAGDTAQDTVDTGSDALVDTAAGATDATNASDGLAADTAADAAVDTAADAAMDTAADAAMDTVSDPACYSDSACDPASVCISDAQGCNGKCVPRHTVGQDCTDGIPCVAGHYCEGVCIAWHLEGEDCYDGIACEPDAVCSLAGTCKKPVESAEGGKCYDGNYCAPGLWCEQTAGISSKTCVKTLTEGTACDADKECAAGLLCVANKCAPAPGEGGACTDVGNTSQCLTGLVCAWSLAGASPAKACLPIKQSGQGCVSNDQCTAPGFYCQGLTTSAPTGTCSPLPKSGKPCAEFLAPWTTLAKCESGLVCKTKAGVPTCMTVAASCM